MTAEDWLAVVLASILLVSSVVLVGMKLEDRADRKDTNHTAGSEK